MICKWCTDAELMHPKREETVENLENIRTKFPSGSFINIYLLTFIYWLIDSLARGSIFTLRPHTPICAQAAAVVFPVWGSERLVIALLPEGLMTQRKPNRSWWCDRAEDSSGEGGREGRLAHHSPLPFCSFSTLQNSLLICCSVWGVWIVPASITIITRAAGAQVPRALSPNGPLRRLTLCCLAQGRFSPFCASPRLRHTRCSWRYRLASSRLSSIVHESANRQHFLMVSWILKEKPQDQQDWFLDWFPP